MPNSKHYNFKHLVKIAQAPTVGDVMTRINADLSLGSIEKRNLLDAIRGTNLPVTALGSQLLHVGLGGILGSMVSKYLGFSPFWQGVSTLGAALYGNKLYNDKITRYNGF